MLTFTLSRETVVLFRAIFISMLGVVVLAGLIFTWLIIWARSGIKGYMEKVIRRRNAANNERARLEGLRPLDTSTLMRTGEKRWSKNSRRTFQRMATYRLVVCDQSGDVWVGFALPQTLESLSASEYNYRQPGIRMPLIGPDEKNGDPVAIGKRKTLLYPRWLNPEHTDTLEWKRWMELEEAFMNTCGNLPEVERSFAANFPREYLIRLNNTRKRFPGVYGWG